MINTKTTKVILSLIIFFYLGLQAFASLGYFSHSLWPFLDYPMYNQPAYLGTLVHRYEVFGTHKDGTTAPVKRQDLGVVYFIFRRDFINAIKESDHEALNKFAEIYHEKKGKKLIRLRLEDSPYELQKDGFVQLKRQVIKQVTLNKGKK